MDSGLDEARIERRTWDEFREAGLLWWVNRGLHLFGWAIVLERDDDGATRACYPARVPYRGFERRNEEWGFKALTHHVAENAPVLRDEVSSDE